MSKFSRFAALGVAAAVATMGVVVAAEPASASSGGGCRPKDYVDSRTGVRMNPCAYPSGDGYISGTIWWAGNVDGGVPTIQIMMQHTGSSVYTTVAPDQVGAGWATYHTWLDPYTAKVICEWNVQMTYHIGGTYGSAQSPIIKFC
ncbi:hypothetical protein Lfu02_41950 [Longispora fulva]|uniref:Secreted protein n=1 Tax=Longispora fulva TaxID=619741 RepID=A0A8J7KJ86_9ACTN|nr:hypothetical protein [Longispora fulva]MBG6136654.1 hypothetical protein [Longispora fulva]GIG59823.1 hypothetical protein Lfu02_41950 [Longispora fulva]